MLLWRGLEQDNAIIWKIFFPSTKIFLFCDFENWCTNAFEMLISFYLCHFLPNFLWMNCISMCLFNMNIFCNIVCVYYEFHIIMFGNKGSFFCCFHCAWGKCDLGKNMRQFWKFDKRWAGRWENPKFSKPNWRGNKCGFTCLWWDISWRYILLWIVDLNSFDNLWEF